MLDAWRLAVGTLTAVPVGGPVTVDRRTAGRAMALAPLAVLPLGLMVGLIGWLALRLDLAPLVAAFLAVGALAAGSRALHWDGLSDVVDGLTSSYSPERSLAVMKSGTSGPAGVVAVVVVLGLQVAGLASLLVLDRGFLLAGLLVCLSRCALVITCARGVRGARADGLGVTYTQTVSRALALSVWLLAALLAALVADWVGFAWWRGLLAAAVAVVVVLVLVRRTVRRFGGVTGDVFGAAMELALAALLVVFS
ncbi:MAG: cobS [Marmoricola sp.]|nr:cobS [Marmoricola sp.]